MPCRYQPLAYSLMRSRVRPPSSSYTGTPSALPLMSHNAVSTPVMALVSTSPPA